MNSVSIKLFIVALPCVIPDYVTPASYITPVPQITECLILTHSNEIQQSFQCHLDSNSRPPCTPSSTRPGFELMTSRSWQYSSCHWDAYSNHWASHVFKGLTWQTGIVSSLQLSRIPDLQNTVVTMEIIDFHGCNYLAYTFFLHFVSAMLLVTSNIKDQKWMWYTANWWEKRYIYTRSYQKKRHFLKTLCKLTICKKLRGYSRVAQTT